MDLKGKRMPVIGGAGGKAYKKELKNMVMGMLRNK